jgi:hypothetical protein
MWSWFRRRQTQGGVPPAPRVLVRVIGCLSPGFVRVVVGPGVGMLDGGLEQDWPDAWVPAPARRPNGEFWVTGFVAGVPQVVEGGPTGPADAPDRTGT